MNNAFTEEESMFRGLRPTFLTVLLAGLVSVSSTSFADDPACKLATKGDSRVAKACASGGVKAAKAEMKEMLKQGKSAGVKMDCDDCHKDDTHYDQLTNEAKDKFKKLLAALEKK
jgi:hypothetical protein